MIAIVFIVCFTIIICSGIFGFLKYFEITHTTRDDDLIDIYDRVRKCEVMVRDFGEKMK
jgi:hypothetical protein